MDLYIFIIVLFFALQHGLCRIAFGSNGSKEAFETFPNCKKGEFWSVTHIRCQPCSLCGPRLYEKVPCSRKRDTRCDWCLAVFPRRNDDFLKKCPSNEFFEKERKLNTKSGSKVLQPGDPEHRFWNFDESIEENENDLPQIGEAQLDSMPSTLATYTSLIIVVLFRLLLLVVVGITVFLLFKCYIKRISSENRFAVKTVMAPQFTDEQNQIIIKSAIDLEKIIGKECYEGLQNPQFV